MPTKNQLSPEPEHVWDPRVAYSRLADGDAEALTKRLRQAAERYAAAPAGHLSLAQLGRLTTCSDSAAAEHRAHLAICDYCTELKNTLYPG
jgi:hypothetical protein